MMNSGCISDSSIGSVDRRIPARATYKNLFQWPDSDVEFIRSESANNEHNQYSRYHPRVVNSYYCRQMYLRSYTFSRKETSVAEKTKMCLGKVKEKVAEVAQLRSKRNMRSGAKRLKETSCSAIYAVFRRLLLCSASVDVVDI